MANTLEADILKVLNETGAQIRSNMQREGVNASGRTSASIHTRVSGTHLQLVGGGEGAAPIPTLELGRRDGKVPAGFYGMILQWSYDKGLNFESDAERRTFAYFVSRKIAAEGSQRYRDPSKRKDIYSTAVEQATEKIRQIARANVRNTIAAAVGRVQTKSLRGAFN